MHSKSLLFAAIHVCNTFNTGYAFAVMCSALQQLPFTVLQEYWRAPFHFVFISSLADCLQHNA